MRKVRQYEHPSLRAEAMLVERLVAPSSESSSDKARAKNFSQLGSDFLPERDDGPRSRLFENLAPQAGTKAHRIWFVGQQLPIRGTEWHEVSAQNLVWIDIHHFKHPPNLSLEAFLSGGLSFPTLDHVGIAVFDRPLGRFERSTGGIDRDEGDRRRTNVRFWTGQETPT
jgi:hypothetical protein